MRLVQCVVAVCALLAPIAATGQSSASWAQAVPGRVVSLPADHVSHPAFRIEWWYYTGNLWTEEGRRFGYQVTFFRVGIVPAPTSASRWAVRDLFMTHIAITDVSGHRHRAAERMNRAGIGWAGARTDRYDVWNDDWRAWLDGGTHRILAMDPADALGVNLSLEEGKPAALEGDRGFSQKGATPGNASYYYSLTRMPTRGTVVLDGSTYTVSGQSWMDHEFGTSFLEAGQTGWDWLSLQLDDGTDLMLYRLRREDGSTDTHSSGTVVDARGSTASLSSSAFTLSPGRMWRSPVSGAAYPVEWRITSASGALDLSVRAAVDGQEVGNGLSSGVAYWEGAVDVSGTRSGHRVSGVGYLEMTGYAGRSLEAVLADGQH